MVISFISIIHIRKNNQRACRQPCPIGKTMMGVPENRVKPNSDNSSTNGSSPQKTLKHEDYTVGWICSLEVELIAALEMLDDEHERLP